MNEVTIFYWSPACTGFEYFVKGKETGIFGFSLHSTSWL